MIGVVAVIRVCIITQTGAVPLVIINVKRVNATPGNIEVVVVALIVQKANTKEAMVLGLQAAQLVEKAKLQALQELVAVVYVMMANMQTERVILVVKLVPQVDG